MQSLKSTNWISDNKKEVKKNSSPAEILAVLSFNYDYDWRTSANSIIIRNRGFSELINKRNVAARFSAAI